MIRSFAFKTQGRLHSRDIDLFLMPTLLSNTNLFLWVDLEDPTEEETQVVLRNVFHFHPLSVDDCLVENTAPKVEEYRPREEEDLFSPYLFMVIHAVDYSRRDGVFATSELNFFLGKNFLVTFHDKPLRGVELVAARCAKSNERTAKGPDRVACMLLEAIVENYKPALDELGMEVAELESGVLERPDQERINQVIQIKKEVLHLRQIIGPQREVLARFARGEFKLIRSKLIPYYRNVYDGLFYISTLAQGYADSLTSILQVYLNISSNQTSEVVKLLTLITVVTTPVSLVGAWYGMNFKNMAELDWSHAYLTAIAATGLGTALTFWYFKRRRWL